MAPDDRAIDPDADLDATLAALGLPPRALVGWLDELERFCRAHGGARHYRALLALVDACRARAGGG